jgi:protection-of-telomeres protein 1
MSTQEVSEPSSSAPVLPPGFRTIEDIQGLPSDKIRAGEMVSVIGFIKDYQPPIRTKGPGKLLYP